MDRNADNFDKAYNDGFEGVTFDSDGGVIGSTTESSRANNAAAKETSGSIEDTVSPIDGSGYTDHSFG